MRCKISNSSGTQQTVSVRYPALVALFFLFAGIVTFSPGPIGSVRVAHGQSAKSSLKDPDQAAMFNRISDRLVCQCGCNMILRVCNHFECPSAIPMRAKVEQQIRNTIGEDDIVSGFVEEYGKVVLSSPPAEGFDLAMWVMPGFAVLVGALVLGYVLMTWLSRKKPSPAPVAGPRSAEPPLTGPRDTEPRIDPSMTARIEEELKRMDA